MHKMFSTLFIACMIAVTACAGPAKSVIKPELPASAVEKRNLMLGKWFGEKRGEAGEFQQWLATRFADGTYKIHFRLTDRESNRQEQFEVGMWGCSGPVYFSIMQGWIKDSKFIPADPRNPTYYEAYEIIELDRHKFIYRSYEPDMTFEVKKVEDEFELPTTES